MAKLELAGKKFGRLFVVSQIIKNSRSHGVCRCDCGNEKVVLGTHLMDGRIKSCGCLSASPALIAAWEERRGDRAVSGDITSKEKQPRRKYSGKKSLAKGKREHPYTFSSWHCMQRRCTNPRYPGYKNYGGRGITVCDEWYDFDVFLSDMGERPDGCTLDRIENDSGYCASNCRWATKKEQDRNRCGNHFVEYEGRSCTIAELSEISGLKYITLFFRITKYGWSIERAMSTPVKQTRDYAQVADL